ncbi:hypothetical protein B0H17DRAFT_1136106 [Mycena rosella]|uniref:Uncharacterized protein n=1 Tax=Mycena rosella TaxID=1033263 RepID=A0AAD7DBH9_MYCRO|nr:hypothetical protein B0H17DRAFT_1136106 [Mycena rosella]
MQNKIVEETSWFRVGEDRLRRPKLKRQGRRHGRGGAPGESQEHFVIRLFHPDTLGFGTSAGKEGLEGSPPYKADWKEIMEAARKTARVAATSGISPITSGREKRRRLNRDRQQMKNGTAKGQQRDYAGVPPSAIYINGLVLYVKTTIRDWVVDHFQNIRPWVTD